MLELSIGGNQNLECPRPDEIGRALRLSEAWLRDGEALSIYSAEDAQVLAQCGPAGGPLRQRYFKQKDVVENYLTAQVKSGNMDLAEAQKEIARAWTQFLEKAKGWCATHNCRGEP